jgi:hypothetical protein
MLKLKTLLVIFDTQIAPSLVSSFRGAVISKVGFQNQAFHNHDGDNFIYKYPLIQYKLIHEKASLYCVGDGVDEIHHFFGLKSWDIMLQDKLVPLKIYKLNLNTFNMNTWDKKFRYSIYNWLALNEKNYGIYHAMQSLVEKISFLEKMLTGNILSFAKGIGWHIDKPVEVKIQELKGEKMIRYKGIPLMAFDVNFSSNVFLPNYLGLGKSASHGYGVVREVKSKS